MYRITDPKGSRAFYEALGFRLRRELPIVRDGELEATNYFFGMPDDEAELELTFNHDGRSYDLGTGYGHICHRRRRPRRHAGAAEGARHRAGARAVHRARRRVSPLLRAGPDS